MLLVAALGGLLSINEACSSASSSAGGSTGATIPDAPIPATGCDAGVLPNPSVTATTAGALTQAELQAKCDAQQGIFELQPHCGGSNSCRGFSYDSETQVLSEHTCRGMNSCGGFSCVVCG
jgi:hypothetical protein